MRNENKVSFLKYLVEVLGISSLISPLEQEEKRASLNMNKVDLVKHEFLTEADLAFNGEFLFSPSEFQKKKILFLSSYEKGFSLLEKGLYQDMMLNMIKAMKLQSHEVDVFEFFEGEKEEREEREEQKRKELKNQLSLSAALNYSFIVCFDEAIYRCLKKDTLKENIILTHAPKTLQAQPHLKKETWESLKKVMVGFSALTH